MLMLVVGLFIGVWFAYQYIKTINFNDTFVVATKNPNKEWKVEFLENKDFKNISEDQKNFILKSAVKKLKLASQTELEDIAITIQNYLSAKSVHVMKVGVNDLVIAIDLHEPFLQIATKSTIRYLTEDGDIYGKVSTSMDENMPLITGIFDARTSPFELSKNMTVEKTSEEAALVSEAIELFKQSKKFNYNVKKINYIFQRGFSINLDDLSTTVVLGKAPFNDKFKNLNKILSEYKNNGSQALKIELDYNNKAFIKEENVISKEKKM